MIVHLWEHLFHFLFKIKLAVWSGEFVGTVELVPLTILFSKNHDKKCDRNSNKSLHISRRQNSMPYFSKIYSPDNKKASHKEFPWQVLIPDDDIRCAGTLVKLDVSDFLRAVRDWTPIMHDPLYRRIGTYLMVYDIFLESLNYCSLHEENSRHQSTGWWYSHRPR